MKLDASQVDQYHSLGFITLPGFLPDDLLRPAQQALQCHYPSPEDYFADRPGFEYLSASQFAGLVSFPFGAFEINRLVVTPALVAIAKQLLGTDDIRLTKGELWAKYQGAIDYDQDFHRDFGNHTLVVPRTDHRWKELTTFIYLSDVSRDTGATAVIPRQHTDGIPFGKNRLPKNHPARDEAEFVEGPAGTLVMYSYDVFHRGVEITRPGGYRFMVLADFARRDAPWIDRHAWPHHGLDKHMIEFMERIEPGQRNLMDFPPVGHPYWNAQTLADIQVRYPNMDVDPYRAG